MTEKETIKDDLYETFHENGQLWERGYLKNREVDGLWEVFYENGQLQRRGNYKDGKMDGLQEMRNEK